MRKLDPELLPIQRPRCPKCQARMMSVGTEDAPDGFEKRTFECLKCQHGSDVDDEWASKGVRNSVLLISPLLRPRS